ncbi:class II fructose-1,6-bisphosphate aldolase [candidate division WWE3 bacterium]|uniref:Class II fructose-1,6-bisphosphate aldolase n=1 Tax=candidate division WWE3 bacterium TaxID=2053526 RepID=A0A928TUK3_UNCKA|nr:class II fructose-1,6-bisphosphate aldolase [candidate division WWE3 bacterium]
MLVTAKTLLVPARKKKYAIPAFNVNNLEFLKSVMAAAEAMKSPVIVQTSEGAVEYAGMDYLVAMIRVAASGTIPVAMHLDHGKDLDIIRQAIRSGYSSVMIDASALPYKENVTKTKKVVRWAHAKRISVEAEIGALAGIEDLVSVQERDAKLTDPEEALRFANDTGCDSLAVAIGTAHGAFKFKGITHVDIPRLQRIASLVKLPIVLHGASGVREDLKQLAERHGAKLGKARGVLDGDIRKAIRHGVAKVNIDTDLRIAFTAGIRESVDSLPTIIDPRKLLERPNVLLTEVAKQKMKLFGSAGRA